MTLLKTPLRSLKLGGSKWHWYDLDALSAELRFGLLFVDGPAGILARMARYPALPLLRERLADEAFIFLDDFRRKDEIAIVCRWLQEFPELTLETQGTQGSAAVLRLGGTSSTGV